MTSLFVVSDVATSYRVEPAIERATRNRALATSVSLGENPLVRSLAAVIKEGTATISKLAVLPFDAEAEARLEKLLAEKRGVPVRALLKKK